MGGAPAGRRSGRIAGVVVALLVTASACGPGDPTGVAEDDPAAAVPPFASSPATVTSSPPPGAGGGGATGVVESGGPVQGGGGGETIEDLEAAWAARRAAIVDLLSAETLGVDESGLLRGPAGFSFDLNECPDDWNDLAGIDETTIRIAVTSPQSGPQATFNEIALGMKAYFDWVNSRGGVSGRSVQLVVRDDAYDPTFTTVAVDELLATEPPPLYLSNVGSPGALAVQDTLNDNCVPQPFVASSHPALGDPVGRPWTTGLQMSLSTEAIMWGRWLEQYLPDQVPVSVAALVIDNDFGQIYLDSFQNWAGANPNIVSELTVIRHDPAASTISGDMAQLAEAEPDVLLSMTTGAVCTSVLEEAAKFGLDRSTMVRFTPAGCTQPVTYMAPAGTGADGVYSVGAGMRSTNDKAFAEDTFVAFVNQQLIGTGLDPARELIGVGFAQYGWAHVEILRIASELPGGLSRSTVLLALRGADLVHPMSLDGVRFATNGSSDAYFVEGASYNRYDAGARAWYQQGPALDINGISPNCSWAKGRCQP